MPTLNENHNVPANSKPFNLINAIKGQKLITRNGKPAQLVSIKVGDAGEGIFPLAASVGCDEYSFTLDGCFYSDSEDHYLDLFMAPREKTVYVNLYHDKYCYHFETEDEANESSSSDRIGGKAYPVTIAD